MQVLGQDRRREFGRTSERRFVIVFLMTLSFFLSVSSLYAAQASVFEKARENVVDVAAPILAFFAGPIQFVGDVFGDVDDYFAVRARNKELEHELAELQAWKHEALRLREQLSRYDRLMQIERAPDWSHVAARVIGESNGPYKHTMIVNVGKEDYVREGSAVVDDYGLIGHVLTAGNGASRILLLTDLNSRVPVYVEGANAQAILVGQYAERPVLKFISAPDPDDLAPGQRVLTSGRGGVLPRGLPVGELDAIGRGGPLVSLYSDFDRTDVVQVILYEFPKIDNDVAAGESGTP